MNNDIYSVFYVTPTDEQIEHNPVGRFMVVDNNLHILEDYHGLMEELFPEGPISPKTENRIDHLPRSSYLYVESESTKQLANQPQPPLEVQSGQTLIPTKPPGVFEYQRLGHDTPHTLQFNGPQATLDGHLLSPEELELVANNVRLGLATLRYKEDVRDIMKMESEMLNSAPIQHNPQEILKYLSTLATEGTLDPEMVKVLRSLVYEDPMVKGVGNKYAFEEFKGKNRPGVFISMDGNDFKHINDNMGHNAGDDAIKALGKAVREAMDESVGSKSAKVFRNGDKFDHQNLYRSGGDEFVAHVPTHEDAAIFARALRSKLEEIPAINGIHKLSMGMGFGEDYNAADKALLQSKRLKLDEQGNRKFEVGQTPMLAFSLVSGHEGALPLDNPDASPVSALDENKEADNGS